MHHADFILSDISRTLRGRASKHEGLLKIWLNNDQARHHPTCIHPSCDCDKRRGAGGRLLTLCTHPPHRHARASGHLGWTTRLLGSWTPASRGGDEERLRPCEGR